MLAMNSKKIELLKKSRFLRRLPIKSESSGVGPHSLQRSRSRSGISILVNSPTSLNPFVQMRWFLRGGLWYVRLGLLQLLLVRCTQRWHFKGIPTKPTRYEEIQIWENRITRNVLHGTIWIWQKKRPLRETKQFCHTERKDGVDFLTDTRIQRLRQRMAASPARGPNKTASPAKRSNSSAQNMLRQRSRQIRQRKTCFASEAVKFVRATLGFSGAPRQRNFSPPLTIRWRIITIRQPVNESLKSRRYQNWGAPLTVLHFT